MNTLNRKLRSTQSAVVATFNQFTSLSTPLRAVIGAAAFILLIALTATAFRHFAWPWVTFAAVVGVVFGLIIGYLMLSRVPRQGQFAAVGAFSGMGIDLAATAAFKDAPATALNSLADWVANLVESTLKVVPEPVLLKLPISVGLWSAIGTVALVMLFGLLFSHH